jgi:hypothetical protein
LSILQAVESTCQRRSRLESILNVAGGYDCGSFIGCGLGGRRFEQLSTVVLYLKRS